MLLYQGQLRVFIMAISIMIIDIYDCYINANDWYQLNYGFIDVKMVLSMLSFIDVKLYKCLWEYNYIILCQTRK